MDIASSIDITAFILTFEVEDKVVFLPYFWIPKETAAERSKIDRVPYMQWIDEGYIKTTEGAATDYDEVKKDINKLADEFDIREIAVDRNFQSELLEVFHSRFSYSQLRPALQVKLIEAYNTYGEGDGVIRAAKAFLDEFTESPQRGRVTLLMADAYARQQRVNLEFAAYESLLRELAEQADRVPIGTPELTGASQGSTPPGMAPAARRALSCPGSYAATIARRVG